MSGLATPDQFSRTKSRAMPAARGAAGSSSRGSCLATDSDVPAGAEVNPLDVTDDRFTENVILRYRRTHGEAVEARRAAGVVGHHGARHQRHIGGPPAR